MNDAAVAAPRIGAETMEKVLLQGDLKALTPRERLSYYNRVCESLGLNPLTRPFEYLNLNGKLLLYAKRECTEQLRQIHGVNLTILTREVAEGCYVVTAMATLPNGRQDTSLGAVSLEGLKGESRANAIMKAETKAKRRVTLSICGLTFLDESEVEPVGSAHRVAVDPQTGELSPAEESPPNFREMIEAFGRLKAEMGPDREWLYYEVLHRHGVKHCNEFEDMQKARACYRELKEAIENFLQAQPQPESI